MKPILFSTDMVRAIRDGSKTQTRRVLKLPFTPNETFKPTPIKEEHIDGHQRWEFRDGTRYQLPIFKCPYGKPGDILWVRERFLKDFHGRYFYYADFDFSAGVHYMDDNSRNETIEFRANHFKPSIHMPRAACRLFLKIKSIRVERLQDISESDIIAEGIQIPVNGNNILWELGTKNNEISFLPENSFKAPGELTVTNYQVLFAHWAELWCKLNDRESWNANPWVWVIEFERTEKPTT